MLKRPAHAFPILAALVGSLALGACGSDDEDDVVDAGRNLAKEPGLQGSWVSTCDKYGPLEASGRAYYAFEPLRYAKKVALFGDGGCTTAQSEIVYRGEFKVGNADDLPEGVNRVNLTPGTVNVRALNEDGARFLNAAKLCGISDYKVGEERDVTAAAKESNCLPEAPGATQYDVYRIDEKKLQFGSAYLLGAPVDANKRPAALNQRVFEPTEKWE